MIVSRAEANQLGSTCTATTINFDYPVGYTTRYIHYACTFLSVAIRVVDGRWWEGGCGECGECGECHCGLTIRTPL